MSLHCATRRLSLCAVSDSCCWAGTFFILFALYIPISLFVTLELVRFGQALFMRWDILEPAEAIDGLDWGDPDTGSSGLIRLLFSTVGGIKPRTSSLNEDLGRIQHVFSDKTGTLTKNVMVRAPPAAVFAAPLTPSHDTAGPCSRSPPPRFPDTCLTSTPHPAALRELATMAHVRRKTERGCATFCGSWRSATP